MQTARPLKTRGGTSGDGVRRHRTTRGTDALAVGRYATPDADAVSDRSQNRTEDLYRSPWSERPGATE